jgi:hypothetical protein
MIENTTKQDVRFGSGKKTNASSDALHNQRCQHLSQSSGLQGASASASK